MDVSDVENLSGNWYCTECEYKRQQVSKQGCTPRGMLTMMYSLTSGKTPAPQQNHPPNPSHPPLSLLYLPSWIMTWLPEFQRCMSPQWRLSDTLKEVSLLYDHWYTLFLALFLVTMDKNGQYVDTSVIKSKSTRYACYYYYSMQVLSHRHWHRTDPNDDRKLKDKDDNFISCFRCRKTALRNKRIVSCDYCPLYWHMDCLDPPMTSLPNPTRKWMCPNHADHLMVPYLINDSPYLHTNAAL